MIVEQQTIRQAASGSGIGLHTGCQATITFKPAEVGTGVRFVRIDLKDSPEVPADIDHVVGLERGTTLQKGEARVHTVEHVLAAVAGLQIDNLIIELDNIEPPVFDGSARPFVDILLQGGIVPQAQPKNFFEIDAHVSYSEKDRGVDIVVVPSDQFRITYMVDYKNPALGTQYTSLVSLEEEFVEEFAPARTFCFLSEVEQLKERGIIKGGGLDSAIVICDRDLDEAELARLKSVFALTGNVFLGSNGILNDRPLRFYNEPVRHKAVDLIGDLFLIGAPIKGHILAARSGHAANVALAKKLRSIFQKKQIKRKYSGKAIGDYVLDINAIQKIMPHRYPFLLIDRILDIVPNESVTALKNVTINEPFFQGHFPGHPIMPGVLIVEAMAQAGGFLLLNTVENADSKVAYFMGIDGVRFRKPVLPGDQLRFELKMISFRRSTCKMTGMAYVGEQLVCEAEMMAAVVDR
ncbi:MAG: bifunctional UDP-3-O-[3-hydroxymyristoyl] N-acetylglucosamine deacetylase/3-hydroxyacyl-ACP dehydratase [bacterium]|nr:bifunctional UDP-3-O-[3-hydroxymyristoyl] N-acetylglucosamine deacetylase/3-hydroxyacyl-ACP dehydratase [bacterium]